MTISLVVASEDSVDLEEPNNNRIEVATINSNRREEIPFKMNSLEVVSEVVDSVALEVASVVALVVASEE